MKSLEDAPLEDALSDAMRSHVAGVQAPPGLGNAVRRRRRAAKIRFRTAGAVLVSVAVAAAVPAYSALTSTTTAVPTQRVASGPGTPSTAQPVGKGRELGGVRIGYLPPGLFLSFEAGQDAFGETSNSSAFSKPDQPDGMYAVQVIVYRGDAAKWALGRVPRDAKAARGDDERKMFFGHFTENNQVVPEGGDTGGTTPVLVVWDDSGAVVDIMMSPTYFAELKGAARGELTAVGNGLDLSGGRTPLPPDSGPPADELPPESTEVPDPGPPTDELPPADELLPDDPRLPDPDTSAGVPDPTDELPPDPGTSAGVPDPVEELPPHSP
ncbi:hypothetical protein [Sinosporangium siamense]|uniref:Uncharacterized protein n=1 Tax=Sinosporangium siamense TaxID=1367973 RepID=A0A919VCN4_9ACTN|nr:hypothetical protein [Sinosporangium siamense]GII93304.1 hypothetical protein Ssi02_35350 [Sinosporangium siamense]